VTEAEEENESKTKRKAKETMKREAKKLRK